MTVTHGRRKFELTKEMVAAILALAPKEEEKPAKVKKLTAAGTKDALDRFESDYKGRHEDDGSVERMKQYEKAFFLAVNAHPEWLAVTVNTKRREIVKWLFARRASVGEFDNRKKQQPAIDDVSHAYKPAGKNGSVNSYYTACGLENNSHSQLLFSMTEPDCPDCRRVLDKKEEQPETVYTETCLTCGNQRTTGENNTIVTIPASPGAQSGARIHCQKCGARASVYDRKKFGSKPVGWKLPVKVRKLTPGQTADAIKALAADYELKPATRDDNSREWAEGYEKYFEEQMKLHPEWRDQPIEAERKKIKYQINRRAYAEPKDEPMQVTEVSEPAKVLAAAVDDAEPLT